MHTKRTSSCRKRTDSVLLLLRSMSLLVLVLQPPTGNAVSLQVYVNASAEYGAVTSIVLSISSLPSKRFGTRITTSLYNYLIANFVTTPTNRQNWRSTNDLTEVLAAHGVQPQRGLEYRRCVYYVANATFYSVGHLRILVETYALRQADHYVEVLLKMSAGTVVYKPPGQCVPVVKVPNCGGPTNMLKRHVSSTLILNITVQDDCKQTAAPTYRWTIYDVAEKEALRTYPATRRSTLTINNFRLKCNKDNVVDQCAICIRLEGTMADVAYAVRCYVDVQHGRVHAEILGGRFREVSADAQIRLDGRRSRDLTYVTGAKQTLYYVWDCSSATDETSSYCERAISTDGVVDVPAGSFREDNKYTITLTVSSDHAGSRVQDTARQLLSVVAEPGINGAIICLFNCELDLYSPDKKVHLEAACVDCDAQPLDYDWQIEGVSVSSQQLLVVWLHTSKDHAYVDLSISTRNGHHDQVRKVLYKNFGPKKGKCSIKPSSGQEVLTKFSVLCLNFSTPNPPVLFYLIAKKVVIRVCRATPCPLPLPVTNGLTVRICDTLRVCVEDQIAVEVTPYVRVPGNAQQLQQMLDADPHLNVAQLLQQGKLIEAYIVLNSLAAKVAHEQEAKVLLDCLAQHQPKRGSEVGKLANITRTLAESLQPLSTASTKTLTGFLQVLNDNFARVHERGLIHELGLGPYLSVAQAAVSLLSIFTNVTETLPLPPQFIYELAERQPLTERLVAHIRQEISLIPDAEAVERSTVWLNATWQLQRLLHYLGLAGAQHLRPDEDLLSIVSQGVAFELSCMYVQEQDPQPEFVIKTHDDIHEVVFSAALLRELSAKLDSSYICLKVISVLRYLFWWYPEERQPSSRLLTVRAYARDDVFSHELALKNTLNFMEVLGRYKPAQRAERSKRAVVHEAGQRVQLRLEKVDRWRWQREVQADADDNIDDAWLWSLGAHANVLAYALAARLAAVANASTHKLLAADMSSAAALPRTQPLVAARPHATQPRTVEDEQRIATSGLYINCIVNDSMHTYDTTRIYRALLDPHTMLAIRFLRATHDFRVVIHCKRPNRLDISRSACIVRAGSTNRTIMVLNRSARAGLVYMGMRVYTNRFAEVCPRLHPDEIAQAVESGPARYSFVFQMRACDYWVYSAGEPYWSQYGCWPTPQANVAKGMYCNCSYLSTYTAYVWNVVAIPVMSFGCSFDVMPTNSFVVLFYALLCSGLLLLLLLSLLCGAERRHVTYNCESVVDEPNLAGEPHLLVVELSTGAHAHAGTTANVSLVFQTVSRHELHFTIYQEPERPVLNAHSTHTVRLYTRDIRLPTKLAISHDNNGRYPRWQCRSIVLYDLQTRQRQEFQVERWIGAGQLLALTAPLSSVQDFRKLSWRARFRRSMELNFFNWFMFQPLFGMWRSSPRLRALTRFERICIWSAKFLVTFCAAALYYGRTTIDNYELERDKYLTAFLPILDLLFLGCICFVCATFVHYVFVFILVPLTYRHQ